MTTKTYKFSMINKPERPYLRWLKEGIKTAEGRINSEKYKKINIGDIITFTDTQNDNFIEGIVTFKHEYKTFETMLKVEGVKNMLPFLDDDDLAKGVQIYRDFPGSQRIEKYGCVAIGIKVTESKLTL